MPIGPLNPYQVNELLKDFTTRMIHSLPPPWHQLFIDFRAMGSYVELDAQIITVTGGAVAWEPGALEFFLELRQDMFKRGEGTWFSLKYHLVHPSRFEVRYNWRQEPDWTHVPPPECFRQESEKFPRDEETVPEWLGRRLAESTTP
jgi:hypothetical protein